MILIDEAATMALGARLASVVRAGDIVTLSGPLGVGKTALARGLIAALGHVGEVPSPSFTFVQQYDDIDPPVWHVDLYRIAERGEIAELGLDCADEALLVVEWPERADPRSWVDALRLALEFTAKGDRILTADAPPSWEGRWPLR